MQKLSSFAKGAALFLASLGMLLAGLGSLAIGCDLLLKGETAAAAVALAAGLLLLFAVNIDRFEVLKGFGLEAKTRKLDTKIAEVDALLANIRAVAELACEAAIRAESRIGRMDSATGVDEAMRTVEATSKLLADLGSSSAVVQRIGQPARDVLAFDALYSCSQPLQAALGGLDTQRRNRIAELEAQGDAGGMTRLIERDLARSAEIWRAFQASIKGGPGVDEALSRLRVLDQIASTDTHEEYREAVARVTSPWIARLDHLQRTGGLQDPDEWRKLRTRR